MTRTAAIILSCAAAMPAQGDAVPVVTDRALVASDAAAFDAAATAVAADGALVAFGVRGHDGGLVNRGAAYLFARAAAGWSQVQKITPAAPRDREEFGHAVAVRGGVLVVGAPKSDRDGVDAGSAWIFESNGANFVEVARLAAPAPSSGGGFGAAVAVDGVLVAVGEARGLDGSVPAGVVHLHRRGATAWVLEAVLRHPGVPTAEDEFGFAVAAEGELVVVGAPGDDGAAVNAGAAFVFERLAGEWRFVARLESPYPEELAEFGRSVALSDGRIVVGAYREDAGAPESGAVHVFERVGAGKDAGWTAVARLVPTVPEASAEFGCAVAADAGDIVIGAQRAGVSAPGAGGASLFRRGPAGAWSEVAQVAADGATGADFAGAAVAVADGRLVFGAPLRSLSLPYQGAAFVADLSADCDGDLVPDAAEIAAGAADCDANLVPDECDIAAGAADDDGNGVPDACEIVPCPADITGNEVVNGADLAILLSEWGTPGLKLGADIDGSGLVDGVDLAILLSSWGVCP